MSADLIAGPVHHIVTLSLIQNKFPTEWKLSKVIPLHKKGSKLESSNYRPVSILSPISKVLEKIVFEQIYAYFASNKIFNSNLHGYMKNRSTLTALLTMYNRWIEAASRGQVSGAVFIDLSAAFDLVDPQLLLKKLEIYGLNQDALSWITSYLSDRGQAVWIDHILSDFLKCPIGVPQGSNLGPLLFLVFFNDLPKHLESNVDTYADDTTISATDTSLEAIGNKLTKDCQILSKWMKCNRLKLNPEKTQILTLGTNQRLKTVKELKVSMDGMLLQSKDSNHEILLGCHIDGNLNWDSQVSALKSKLSQRLCGLMHLKSVCPLNIRKIIAEGLFNSVLLYCLPLFGGLEKKHIKELQTLQNKAARLVCNLPPRSSRQELFKRLDWMSIHQLICYHTLIVIFKIRLHKDPPSLAKLVCRDSRNGRIQLPRQNLSLALRSFCYRGPEIWNRLPSRLRNLNRIGQFKTELRKWITGNIPLLLD